MINALPKLKEMTNISTKDNRLKYPYWLEADQLAIYKQDRRVGLECNEFGALTTRPRCFLWLDKEQMKLQYQLEDF